VSESNPSWEGWKSRPRERFNMELDSLISDKLVNIEIREDGEYIFVPAFFLEHIRELWSTAGETPEQSFPDKSCLQGDIPQDLISDIVFQNGFAALLSAEDRNDMTIINLVMPEPCGSIVILFSMLKNNLFNEALKKLQFFLRKNDNSKYLCQKLAAAQTEHNAHIFPLIEELTNSTTINLDIKGGNANLALIISMLCDAIREHVGESNKSVKEKLGTLQSTYIIDAYSTFYREQKIANNKDAANIEIIESGFERSPYIFTISNIFDFKSTEGKTVSSLMEHSRILDLIKKKNSVTAASQYLPELLVFYDDNKTQHFVLKTKLYHAFGLLLNSSRQIVFNELHTIWKKLITEYREDKSMKNDIYFEEYVIDISSAYAPLLLSLYQDIKFKSAILEIKQDDGIMAKAAPFFVDGFVRPLSKIFSFEKRKIIALIKLELPFWYSVPLFIVLIRFFKGIK
jgi:hypothetical protein